MEKAIAKIQKRFPHRVLSGINVCLRNNCSVSATILLCCAIDLLSKYFTGNKKSAKTDYIKFLEKYFPQYLDTESFYKFVRCGLVHSFSLERKYIIIGSHAEWAMKLNMQYSPKHKLIIINPWTIREDLKSAVSAFLSDLKDDRKMIKRLKTIYKFFPLEGQMMKTAKFKYLIDKET